MSIEFPVKEPAVIHRLNYGIKTRENRGESLSMDGLLTEFSDFVDDIIIVDQ